MTKHKHDAAAEIVEDYEKALESGDRESVEGALVAAAAGRRGSMGNDSCETVIDNRVEEEDRKQFVLNYVKHNEGIIKRALSELVDVYERIVPKVSEKVSEHEQRSDLLEEALSVLKDVVWYHAPRPVPGIVDRIRPDTEAWTKALELLQRVGAAKLEDEEQRLWKILPSLR